jgi:hypothetical protein
LERRNVQPTRRASRLCNTFGVTHGSTQAAAVVDTEVDGCQ